MSLAVVDTQPSAETVTLLFLFRAPSSYKFFFPIITQSLPAFRGLLTREDFELLRDFNLIFLLSCITLYATFVLLAFDCKVLQSRIFILISSFWALLNCGVIWRVEVR